MHRRRAEHVVCLLFCTPSPVRATLFPYTTLFRSNVAKLQGYTIGLYDELERISGQSCGLHRTGGLLLAGRRTAPRSSRARRDRKSTRLNSSHTVISYAVFCLKKKTNNER